jgi:hypothetical protein
LREVLPGRVDNGNLAYETRVLYRVRRGPAPAMITGCNTNIRHLEMIFHVQTEDSGRENPHIISHVYCGGTIVGSRKQDYSEVVESPDFDREVRSRIEEQHKAMLKALRSGEFDAAIEERLAAQPASATQPEIDAPASSTSSRSTRPAGQKGRSGATTGNVTTPQVDTDPGPSTEGPVPAERVPTEKVARPSSELAFGASVDAQKPLDEVILEYLVEKARERSSDRRSPAKKRSKG